VLNLISIPQQQLPVPEVSLLYLLVPVHQILLILIAKRTIQKDPAVKIVKWILATLRLLASIQAQMFQIFQVVKENNATTYQGSTPQDDVMERLLRSRKGMN
jgi:hypothetical protein